MSFPILSYIYFLFGYRQCQSKAFNKLLLKDNQLTIYLNKDYFKILM